MTYIPIIINNTREVSCIVHEGIKYCEKVETSPKTLGFAMISVVGLFVYIIMLFVISSYIEDNTHISGGVVLISLILLSILIPAIILIL